MEQLERIRYMERLFDFALETMKESPMSHDKYVKAKEAITTLSDYYGSDGADRSVLCPVCAHGLHYRRRCAGQEA